MQIKDKKILTAIGMMSGTSMDGIDLALIKSDGKGQVERSAALENAYTPAFKEKLAQALEDAKQIASREQRPASLKQVEAELTQLHAQAFETFLQTHNLDRQEIDLIGFHGQTVLHRPNEAVTVQLGDGEALAKACGVSVVFDMRAEDMEHGGQGAPLIPIYHQALAHSLPIELRSELPVAFVNIGGISNITYIGQNSELIAFDTGPGNALIDQWVQSEAGIPFDQGGLIAAEGGIAQDIVDQYLAESFFEQTVPKSLDRNDFKPMANGVASLEDGARTLAHVTAAAIVKSTEHLPQAPKLWIVCGGGRKHPSIMADLTQLAKEQGGEVISAEKAQLDGDAMEAEAWGYLAIRSVKGLPMTFPTTTGCKTKVVGGKLVLP